MVIMNMFSKSELFDFVKKGALAALAGASLPIELRVGEAVYKEVVAVKAVQFSWEGCSLKRGSLVAVFAMQPRSDGVNAHLCVDAYGNRAYLAPVDLCEA